MIHEMNLQTGSKKISIHAAIWQLIHSVSRQQKPSRASYFENAPPTFPSGRCAPGPTIKQRSVKGGGFVFSALGLANV